MAALRYRRRGAAVVEIIFRLIRLGALRGGVGCIGGVGSQRRTGSQRQRENQSGRGHRVMKGQILHKLIALLDETSGAMI